MQGFLERGVDEICKRLSQEKSRLRVTIPFLPPSSNNIYKNIPHKGRILSSAADQFRLRAMRIIQQEGRAALLHLKQDVPYRLTLTFYFEAVENEGWSKTWSRGAKAGERKAASRFKRIDLSNRIKLLEDVVAKAVGIDDCHTFHLAIIKACDPKKPRVEVCLEQMPESGGKEDETQTGLRQAESHRAGGDLPKGGVPGHTSRGTKNRSDSTPGRRGGGSRLLRARPHQ